MWVSHFDGYTMDQQEAIPVTSCNTNGSQTSLSFLTCPLLFQTCLSHHEEELAAAEKEEREEKKKKATKQSSRRQPKSHDPSGLPVTSDDGEDSAEEGGGGAVAGVVIFLIVVAVVGVGAFVILRTRLAPRLRARLTNTPYGDVGGTNGGRIGRTDSTQNVIA